MNRILPLSIATAFLLIGLSSFAQVKSDYDKEVDFTSFKAYSFEGWQKNSDSLLNEFDKKRILKALKSEFDSRGMSQTDENADLKIALYVVLDKKTSTTAYTDYMGGMGFGPRWGWGMGMGQATTTYQETDYIEGTLVVDVYDGKTKKLIWQGVLTTIVKETAEKREKSIPKKIKKLMNHYPISPIK